MLHDSFSAACVMGLGLFMLAAVPHQMGKKFCAKVCGWLAWKRSCCVPLPASQAPGKQLCCLRCRSCWLGKQHCHASIECSPALSGAACLQPGRHADGGAQRPASLCFVPPNLEAAFAVGCHSFLSVWWLPDRLLLLRQSRPNETQNTHLV